MKLSRVVAILTETEHPRQFPWGAWRAQLLTVSTCYGKLWSHSCLRLVPGERLSWLF